MGSNAHLAWLGSVILAALSTGWCVVDARQRGRPLLSVVQMIMFITWFVSVPMYLIVSRGWRGLAYTVIHGIGISLISSVGFAAALYCAYGADAFSATAP
jgi:hypothetical protein